MVKTKQNKAKQNHDHQQQKTFKLRASRDSFHFSLPFSIRRRDLRLHCKSACQAADGSCQCSSLNLFHFVENNYFLLGKRDSEQVALSRCN